MSRRLPVPFTQDERRLLLNAICASIDHARSASKRYAACRDCVMFFVGIIAGLRVSELCSLRIERIDLKGDSIGTTGKGNKDRNIPIDTDFLKPLLLDWIGERTEGWLFPGRRGRPLCRRTVQYRLDALGRAAGLPKHVHPHLMRHTFATTALQSGADIKEVQELLGHSSIQTTARYLHVEVGRLRGVVNRVGQRL